MNFALDADCKKKDEKLTGKVKLSYIFGTEG